MPDHYEAGGEAGGGVEENGIRRGWRASLVREWVSEKCRDEAKKREGEGRDGEQSSMMVMFTLGGRSEKRWME